MLKWVLALALLFRAWMLSRSWLGKFFVNTSVFLHETTATASDHVRWGYLLLGCWDFDPLAFDCFAFSFFGLELRLEAVASIKSNTQHLASSIWWWKVQQPLSSRLNTNINELLLANLLNPDTIMLTAVNIPLRYLQDNIFFNLFL